MIDIDTIQKDLVETVDDLKSNIEDGKIKEFHAVAFDHAGNPSFYYSGNWHSLAKASAFLNLEFINHAQGLHDL